MKNYTSKWKPAFPAISLEVDNAGLDTLALHSCQLTGGSTLYEVLQKKNTGSFGKKSFGTIQKIVAKDGLLIKNQLTIIQKIILNSCYLTSAN